VRITTGFVSGRLLGAMVRTAVFIRPMRATAPSILMTISSPAEPSCFLPSLWVLSVLDPLRLTSLSTRGPHAAQGATRSTTQNFFIKYLYYLHLNSIYLFAGEESTRLGNNDRDSSSLFVTNSICFAPSSLTIRRRSPIASTNQPGLPWRCGFNWRDKIGEPQLAIAGHFPSPVQSA